MQERWNERWWFVLALVVVAWAMGQTMWTSWHTVPVSEETFLDVMVELTFSRRQLQAILAEHAVDERSWNRAVHHFRALPALRRQLEQRITERALEERSKVK